MKLFVFLLTFPLFCFSSTKGLPRVKINLSEFKHRVEGELATKIKVTFDEETLYWDRADGILKPYIHLSIQIPNNTPIEFLSYKGNEYPFERSKKIKKAYLKFSFFDTEPILLKETTVHFQYIGKQKLHHIDYDCLKYHVKIEGADDIPLTASCFVDVFGEAFHLQNVLKIIVKTPHWDENNINILAKESGNKKIQIKNKDNDIRDLSISFKINSRKKRLNLALGLGPYEFTLVEGSFQKDAIISPIMLYANLYIVDDYSLRLFDFFAYNDSMLFNNIGVYFAYPMAEAFDGLIKLTPLLGFQGINVRNEFSEETFSDFIGPQGFEITWHHSFGIENYLVGLGMFLSPGQGTDYKNVWIRWGKNYFWELNFLSYKKEKKEIYTKSWGLSVGFPIGSFF